MADTPQPRLFLLVAPVLFTMVGLSADAAPKKTKHVIPKPLSVRQLVVQIMPSVVRLTVIGKDGQPFAQGSGFVVADDLIVTNSHVIKDAHAVTANFVNGRSEQVFGLVAYDKQHDLVLLRAYTKGVRPLALENGTESQVGDPIVAFGSPEGLGGSISTGVVSGLRMMDGVKVIQTTAPISHGSSGGALVDMKGRVAGVTSFFVEGGQNLNFAYPAAYVRQLMAGQHSQVMTWAEVESLQPQKTAAQPTAPPAPSGPTASDIEAEVARRTAEKEKQDRITGLTASIADTQKQIDSCNTEIADLKSKGNGLIDQEKSLSKDFDDHETKRQSLIAQANKDQRSAQYEQASADQLAANTGNSTFSAVATGLSSGIHRGKAQKYLNSAQQELNDAAEERLQEVSDNNQIENLSQQVKTIISDISNRQNKLVLLQTTLDGLNKELKGLE